MSSHLELLDTVGTIALSKDDIVMAIRFETEFATALPFDLLVSRPMKKAPDVSKNGERDGHVPGGRTTNEGISGGIDP